MCAEPGENGEPPHAEEGDSLLEHDEMTQQIQMTIGKQLRSMYDGVLAEPIPGRILELLEKLDDVSSEGSKGGPKSR